MVLRVQRAVMDGRSSSLTPARPVGRVFLSESPWPVITALNARRSINTPLESENCAEREWGRLVTSTGKSDRLGCSLCSRACIQLSVCFQNSDASSHARALVCVYASHVLHCSEWKSNRWPFRLWYCSTRSELLDEAVVVYWPFLNFTI